jgi:hypothetical protein
MGERAMRVSVLLFIGCLGLLIRAHEMNSDLAGLTGIALGIYGLALALRRPRLGGALTGAGLGMAFLGDGFLPLALVATLVAVLPLAAPAWRTREYATTVAIAAAVAVPLLALFPILLASNPQAGLWPWLDRAAAPRWANGEGGLPDFVYFAKILPWYAWPAWPLAAWSVWKARRSLASRRDLHLPFAALLAFLVVLSCFGEAREVGHLRLEQHPRPQPAQHDHDFASRNLAAPREFHPTLFRGRLAGRRRLHQPLFAGQVMAAYPTSCAVCALRISSDVLVALTFSCAVVYLALS